jgi:hypothetical protein
MMIFLASLLFTTGMLAIWAFALGVLFKVNRPTPKPKPKPKAQDGRPKVNTGTGRRTYAEGRSTMPSEQESMMEYERRTR